MPHGMITSMVEPTDSGYAHEVRIPHERVAVLIGSSGQTKKDIEEGASVTLTIDSHEALVSIHGQDPVNVMIGSDIVRAIGRGFNPEIGKFLLKPDYGLQVISIMDFGKTQNDLVRLRGRVIGEGGKSRRVIEEMTGASVSVFGKTVSIIGEINALDQARRAISMILEGSPHRNVYKWLERQRKLQGMETAWRPE